MTSPLSVPLEDIPSCFEGIIPSSICTVSAGGVPNVTYISVVTRVDEGHVALSRQFFKKTEENAAINPRAQVQVLEPATGRAFQLDLEFERTDTDGPMFERMRTKLDAVAAHEGMEQVFKLKGVDICRVLSCEMVPCAFPRAPPAAMSPSNASKPPSSASPPRKTWTTSSRPHSSPASTCSATPTPSSCSSMNPASSSTPWPAPGSPPPAWVQVRIGEGVIGLAAERRQTVRLTNLGRDLNYSTASRGARVGAPTAERVIPLPTIASMQSQMVIPMLAARKKLVGVICLQSHEAGAFQAADECVVGIMANQVALAMMLLGQAERPATPRPPAAAPPPAPGQEVEVKYYSEDNTVFIDNEYLIKGVAGGIFWRLLKAYQDERRSEFSNKEFRLDQTLDLPEIKDNLEARLTSCASAWTNATAPSASKK